MSKGKQSEITKRLWKLAEQHDWVDWGQVTEQLPADVITRKHLLGKTFQV